jgi:hypothetical protein
MANKNVDYNVKSIRADDETYEKFKVIASEEFGNQGQCLSTLIGLYELEQSKVTLVERKLEINDFQMHLNKIGELFMTSLKLNQDAEIRVRAEFEGLLESKDRMIIDFQGKVDQLTDANEYSTEKLKITDDENIQLFSENIKIKKEMEIDSKEHSNMMADKDNLNKALTESCHERKVEIEKLQIEVETHKAQAEELELIRVNVGEIETKNLELSKELNNQKNDHALEISRLKENAELNKERSLLTIEKTQQKELKELNKQHNEELKGYITKLENLRETYDHSTEQLNSTIMELEHELINGNKSQKE